MAQTPFYPTQATVFSNPGLNNDSLSSSSNVSPSGAGYQQWFTHYQAIWGMWQRVWVFDSEPTLAGGELSGGPQVSFSYVDVSINSQVLDKVEYMNWTSSLQQEQTLSFDSDSSLSGYGTQGRFSTLIEGYTRDKFKTGDKASTCSRIQNVKAGYQPGEYDPTIDTYANLTGDFYGNVIVGVVTACTKFQPDLVKI